MAEILIDAPIQLTPGAIKALAKIKVDEQLGDEHALRIGVKGGGCSGFSYVLGFDLKQENDDMFVVEGIPVLMNKAHAIYLMGMTIDYQDGLNNRGFSFINPNATDTCGCGTSFSA
jgi:iron-sulfur cluster assembly protein